VKSMAWQRSQQLGERAGKLPSIIQAPCMPS
jgi:hypothetical protein